MPIIFTATENFTDNKVYGRLNSYIAGQSYTIHDDNIELLKRAEVWAKEGKIVFGTAPQGGHSLKSQVKGKGRTTAKAAKK